LLLLLLLLLLLVVIVPSNVVILVVFLSHIDLFFVILVVIIIFLRFLLVVDGSSDWVVSGSWSSRCPLCCLCSAAVQTGPCTLKHDVVSEGSNAQYDENVDNGDGEPLERVQPDRTKSPVEDYSYFLI